MGRCYTLVNIDKKEKIDFQPVNTGTKLRELSGTAIASSIITYYMLTHIGDKISFIDDCDIRFVIFGQTYCMEDFEEFEDVTENVVEQLIRDNIYQEENFTWIDKEENLYYRNLTNIWDPKLNKNINDPQGHKKENENE